jgi:hypothetical protein
MHYLKTYKPNEGVLIPALISLENEQGGSWNMQVHMGGLTLLNSFFLWIKHVKIQGTII